MQNTASQQVQEKRKSSGKVHFISLGCARNRVDTEVMIGSMLDHSWEVVETGEEADVIIINTCGFIQSAKEESVDTILAATDIKEVNPELKVVVAGCLTQRYKQQLVRGLPEVDLFVGTDEFPKIADFLSGALIPGTLKARRTNYLYSGELPKKNTLGAASAYVKVAEGCQHNCAFCIIPAIRGRLRSRPIENVVSEVQRLVSDGVLEVNLIAQDLAAYGRDRNRDELLELLVQLNKISGLEWIRLLYVYPENISDEFLRFFRDCEKIVKYLDIPVQHASDRVLTAMNREISRTQLRETITKVRAWVPEVAIRTSVMVGFPGETAEEFDELKEFVKEMRFEHLGCFMYSQEPGTVAGRMPGQLDEDTKRERYEVIMGIQEEISAAQLKKYIGRQYRVLVEGFSQETDLLGQGRLSIQAPEVDGVVLINQGKFHPGAIQTIEITESHSYDLVGRIVS